MIIEEKNWKNRAEIETARWLVKNNDLFADLDLASDNDLLLIAAGKRPENRVRARRLNPIRRNRAIGHLVDPSPIDQPVLQPARIKAGLEDHVLSDRHVHDQPVAMPVGRNVTDSPPDSRLNIELFDRLAV